MTWALNSKKQSGRTTRMLQYAIERAENGLATAIWCLHYAHMKNVQGRLKNLAGDRSISDKLITLLRITDMQRQQMPFGSKATVLNYQTMDFANADPSVCYLFDHSVMEYQLRHVRHYLESTKHIEDVAAWLANTAKALTSLGHKIYIITESDLRRNQIQNMLDGYPHLIAIEHPFSLSNMDWFSLTMRNAHPNCQLLIDPRLLTRYFGGALGTITRWDE